MPARAELSSVATTLEDLAARVERIADTLDASERSVWGQDLTEVQRSLDAARRRLTRLLERERR